MDDRQIAAAKNLMQDRIEQNGGEVAEIRVTPQGKGRALVRVRLEGEEHERQATLPFEQLR